MATQNLTGVDALLKNVYRGPWVEQLNQETTILNILEKTDANNIGTFTGRQIIAPVHSGRNRGRGGVTDGGQLPVAGTQATLDAIITMKYFAAGIEITDQAIKQSKTDEGSFVRTLTFEMDGAKTDMRKDVTRIAYGTGDGLLATVTGTPGAGTSITVDSGQFIAVNDTVDILVKTTGATTNGVVGTLVTAVAYTGAIANSSTQTQATITIGTATAGATSNLYGVYISGDRSQESDGLRNICSTGRTLHQINSSTNAFWDSNIKDFGQANPSEDGIMALAQTIRQRSGKTPDFVMFSLGGQRRLANTYGSQKRWNDDNATKPVGGYSGAIPVSAGGTPIPVMADVDCPAGQGFMLNKDEFGWSELGPADWLSAPDGSGSSILYLKDGTALGTKSRTWQGWLCWDAVLANLAPNRSGKFINMNDDVPVIRL